MAFQKDVANESKFQTDISIKKNINSVLSESNVSQPVQKDSQTVIKLHHKLFYCF